MASRRAFLTALAAGGVAGRGRASSGQRTSAAPAVRWRTDVGEGSAFHLAGGSDGLYAAVDGRIVALGPADGGVRWTAPASEGATPYLRVGEGMVFRAAGTEVAAFDAESGRQRWTYSAPVTSLTAAGATYVGTGPGIVVALEPDDGTVRWRTRLPTPNDAFVVGETDDRVYAYSLGGEVVAIGAESGDEQVQFPATAWSPALADGRVFAETRNGGVVAYDAASGDQQWTYGTREGAPLRPTAVDGYLFAASLGRVVRLDPTTGERLWSLPVGQGTEMPTLPVGVEAGDLYFVSGRGVTAVDVERGDRSWTTSVNATLAWGKTADGGLYLLGGDLAFVRDGTEEWRFDLGGVGESLVLGDDLAYVAGGGVVTALERGASPRTAESPEATTGGRPDARDTTTAADTGEPTATATPRSTGGQSGFGTLAALAALTAAALRRRDSR